MHINIYIYIFDIGEVERWVKGGGVEVVEEDNKA